MSTEKFSPRLLKSILEAEGIDTSELQDNAADESVERPSIRKLSLLERKRALKALAMLIAQFRAGSDELFSFPLENLHEVLRLLAELAAEAKQQGGNQEEKRKALHAAAAMLRRMLHMPDATHYRVLGLEKDATPAQISEHYRLLHELFWFDEAIDPQRKSRLRLSEAYAVLKDPESRERYDEDLARLEQQLLRSVAAGGGRRVWWWGIVAAALLGVGSVLLLYFNGVRNNEIAKEKPAEWPQEQPGEIGGTKPSSIAEADSEQGGPQDQETVSSKGVSSEEIGEKATAPEEAPKTTVRDSTIERAERKPRKELVKRGTSSEEKGVPVASAAGKPAGSVFHRQKNEARVPAEKGKIRRYHIARVPATPGVGKASGSRKREEISPKAEIPPSVPEPVDVLLAPPRIVPSQQDVSAARGHETVAGIPESPDTSVPVSPRVSEPVMVVIGSPSLRVNMLKKEQVRDIFLGREPRLPNGDRVAVFAPQENSSAMVKFYRDVLGKSPRQLRIHWAKIRFQGRYHPLEQVADDVMVRERVARAGNAIGIVRSTAVDDSVKVLFDPNKNL